jgi:5,5'-dehydrodivanillate O-demethylase
MADMDAVEAGRDPKGVIRDPAVAAYVELPIAERDHLVHGMTLADYRADPVMGKHLERFMFQAGQPPEVWEAFVNAMSIPGVKAVDDRVVIEI